MSRIIVEARGRTVLDCSCRTSGLQTTDVKTLFLLSELIWINGDDKGPSAALKGTQKLVSKHEVISAQRSVLLKHGFFRAICA